MNENNENIEAQDIGDFEIDEQEQTSQPVEPNIPEQTNQVDDDSVSVPKEEWENVKQMTEQYEREKAFSSTVENIKAEIPGFDANKVVSKLKEIHTKDPEKASQYNNEIGFKLLWREMTDDVAKNDAVNGGSNKSSGDDFHSAFDDAMQGKDGALKKALAFAK